jgi:hypothetical protein
LARREVKIAEIGMAKLTTLVEFFFIAFGEGLVAVVASYVDLGRFAFEAFAFFSAFLAGDGGGGERWDYLDVF